VRWLLVAALLAACKSDREVECGIVRDTLGKHGGMPRRYSDYSDQKPARDMVIVDMTPLEKLKRKTWHDPDVRAAVGAATESGWTAYTPYSTEATAPLDKLRALCNVE
jgi:hypothetical protein